MTPKYSKATRREYIRQNLGRYRYGESDGYSLREIAADVGVAFDRKPPSASTIQRDLKAIQEPDPAPRTDSAEDLLSPGRFPEWRAEMFQDVSTGEPYQTPKHQMAWFWCFVALAFKVDIPEWVLSYLGIEPSINDDIHAKNKLLSLVILAPPRHGKTDLYLHSCIWAICRNPNIRIIWCSGTKEISKEIGLGYIKTELEQNESLIEKYGPFESSRWSGESIFVAGRTSRAKAPTFLPVGRGSTILSRDADIIVVDDPQGIRAAESEAQTARDYRWLTTQLMTRREPHTALLGIGSFQPSPTGDLWSELDRNAEDIADKRHRLEMVKIRAHDYEECDSEGDPEHTRCILWPEVRPYWFLEAQRSALGDVMFEVCYNQEERKGRLMYFREEVVRGRYLPVEPSEENNIKPNPDLWDYETDEAIVPGILDRTRSFGELVKCCKNRWTYMAIGFDPAAGESVRASETALMVLAGCRFCQRRYVIDYWNGQQSPEQHPETILRFVETYRPDRVRIEKNVYQRALARDKKLTNAQGPMGFHIDSWRTTGERKIDPELGIPVLSRFMESGKFSVPYALPADEGRAEDLLRALIRWPREPNDIPMALWLANLSLQKIIDMKQRNAPKYVPGHENVPDYLKEEAVTIDMSQVMAGA